MKMNRQIDVGVNTELVQEVLNFINSKSLLIVKEELFLKQGLIESFELAAQFAGKEVYGKDELTWNDIRSEKMSELWEVIYSNELYDIVDKQILSLLNDINTVVHQSLSRKYEELLDDIVSDLNMCLYSRAIQGKDNVFFEKIYEAYQLGGWPCGWAGGWPDGEIVIYSPFKY